MDQFEKHIRENKHLFDDKKPDKSKIWQAISTELEETEAKVIPLWKTSKFRAAASIVIILGIVGFFSVNFMSNVNNTATNNEDNIELNEINKHYKGVVAYHVQLVENNTNISSEDKIEFLSFMGELDEEYEVLKLEMNQGLANELVLEAIIKNYKKRIELIENLLAQINNSKKIESDETYIL